MAPGLKACRYYSLAPLSLALSLALLFLRSLSLSLSPFVTAVGRRIALSLSLSLSTRLEEVGSDEPTVCILLVSSKYSFSPALQHGAQGTVEVPRPFGPRLLWGFEEM